MPISQRFFPLHSFGNIVIVYCSSHFIELGNSKQDVSLRNYRSQGMMEEQTEAEVTSVSHWVDVYCFRLSSYSLFHRLPVLILGPYSQLPVRPVILHLVWSFGHKSQWSSHTAV